MGELLGLDEKHGSQMLKDKVLFDSGRELVCGQ